ncbi:S41 family peptidase [Parvularcula maris]|uniref:S41 family peptidase n=1 Tax=Parvularcula maris TaxID=2965077 RepID=A0A9X2L7U6_9PROT|nr:S41 family peptidase [Parvularcula maris]MCQ8184690.1 S41 family peptidase [Parvularcula maris]
MAAVALLGVASCGGSGGGGSTAPVRRPSPPPTTNTPPSWTPGVFAASSSFEQRCERPRTGVDIEGNPFPDRAGSVLEENHWLRSWTDETYLWNNEVPDQNPANFDDPLDYFAELRTTARTPSGTPKDNFHFSQSTEDFLRSRNSAGSSGYGFSLAAIRTTAPRDYRIRYVDPGTPAAAVVGGEQQFKRGTRILEVDGNDLVNGSNTEALNDGLFPENDGETHTFLVQDAGSTQTRLVTITSANVARVPVIETKVIDDGGVRVGYIVFNTYSPFSSEEAIIDAVQTLSDANVEELVLDLRYNGGGLLAVASQLSYMIAGPSFTSGKYFERLRFQADAGNTNPVTGQRNDPTPFYTTGLGFSAAEGRQLPLLPDVNRVFVLSTDRTCSASEATINGLRGVGFPVVLIGDTTCGKPFGFYPTDNCGETYYTIQFQGVNFEGFGDYQDGFVPDSSTSSIGERLPGCRVSDDLSFQLGDESEPLLAAALAYRRTGACPTTLATSSARALIETRSKEPGIVRFPAEDLLSVNRDMRLPGGETL